MPVNAGVAQRRGKGMKESKAVANGLRKVQTLRLNPEQTTPKVPQA